MAYKSRTDRNAYQKRWAEENKDKVKASFSRWKELNKDYNSIYYKNNSARIKYNAWAWSLKSLYGMSVEDYVLLETKQQGLCAICSKPPNKNKRLCVDHCHTTGRVRGLLCDRCNKALGVFEDDTDLFVKATEYLTRSKK